MAEIMLICLSLLQVLFIYFISNDDIENNNSLKLWIIISCLINAFCLVDLIFQFIAFGYHWVNSNKRVLWLETLLQVFVIFAILDFVSSVESTIIFGVSLCNTIFLLRILRLLDLFAELEQFDFILQTFVKL